MKKRGYTRSRSDPQKAIKRLGLQTKSKSNPSPTCRKSKTYEQMTYPGERIQIDVKYVPKDCLSEKFKLYNLDLGLYQYTAIDEFSRLRITDKDTRISLFELTANTLNIQLKHIKPHTPKHFLEHYKRTRS